MIDLSDGLSTDLNHLCRESGVAAEIEAEAIPVSEDAVAAAKHNRHTPLWHALNDGEDFELLLAVDPSDRDELVAKNPIDTLKLTCVGKVVEGKGVTLVQKDGGREPCARRLGTFQVIAPWTIETHAPEETLRLAGGWAGACRRETSWRSSANWGAGRPAS